MYPSPLTQETSKKGGDVERVGSIDIGGVSMTKSGIPELEGDACYLALSFAGSIGAYVPIMAITWILFNAAMKAQDIDKETFLPVRSRFQPDTGYWAFCCAFTFLWVQGYAVFLRTLRTRFLPRLFEQRDGSR